MYEKYIEKNARLLHNALTKRKIPEADKLTESYRKRITEMYASDLFREHNIYPTMNVPHVYNVIAMCLVLKETGMSDREIIDTINLGYAARRNFFKTLIGCIDLLPNSYQIAKNWNIGDHDKRVKDGSITYDIFNASDKKVEYNISGCRYVDMFEAYGIRKLCKIFCITDETAYAGLTRHVEFIRHSDLSDGDCCHDEIFNRKYRK